VQKDTTRAVAWFRRAAENGYPSAQTQLAVHLREGRGVAKNEAEAMTWLRKAADQRYPTAMAALGYAYMAPSDGSTPTYNGYNAAAQWLQLAVDQGETTAQINLGWLYANGLGVDRDPRRARDLWTKAAASDVPEFAEKARANLASLQPVSRQAPPVASNEQPAERQSQPPPRTRADGRPAESSLVRHRGGGGNSDGESAGGAIALIVGAALLMSMFSGGSSSAAPYTGSGGDGRTLQQQIQDQQHMDDLVRKFTRTGTADCWYAVGCAHQ
jgi:hypothetical protein